ncbi:hypothetical protein D3C76_1377060 [compost metagenome]
MDQEIADQGICPVCCDLFPMDAAVDRKRFAAGRRRLDEGRVVAATGGNGGRLGRMPGTVGYAAVTARRACKPRTALECAVACIEPVGIPAKVQLFFRNQAQPL